MKSPIIFSAKEEYKFINDIYQNYNIKEEPQTAAMRDLVIRIFKPYLNGGIGLELGCSDGKMTEAIAEVIDELHVVDASEEFLNQAKSRNLANVSYFNSLFETYVTNVQYDYVFASYVLEHVYEVKAVLNMAQKVLKPSGKLFAVVPNARALSRQLALHMGLINDLKELTENDIKHGHRRVYDRTSFNRDLEEAGFSIMYQGGIMLKILADFQMNKLIGDNFLTEQHIEGLYKLGLEYPDFSGSLFAICVNNK
jgi:2-polyprenyl-3-methyl-5-hydroxy-6-metoxy-1,4-benzoquinol methylase